MSEPEEATPPTAAPPEPAAAAAATPTADAEIPVEVEAGAVEPAAPEVVVVAAPPANDLADKVAALEKEKKENWERYLRAAADLENLRKRQRREIDEVKLETKGKVLKEMLPVVDNLERAIEHASTIGEKNPIVEGVQLVLRQFTTAFERLEVTQVDAMGKPFDPNMHEAISQMESDEPPGTVVQVLQRGYKAGDRLLRPTLVVVAKAKAAPAE